ncbi:MAG TPA: universal stress protein [Thermoanaerobaculia bacterium]|jgi:nucleotide-binding universal stress UspA family protein|nr:universal stress protein [Thermoanaerobaculia bacterium]
MNDIRTVLIGTDLDSDSDALVSTGVQVARAAGAKVHVAFSFAPPVVYLSELGAGIDDSVLAREEQQSREALAEQARQAGIAESELHGLTVRRGAPHRMLPELAEEIGADLLILGATAGGRLHRRLGSTADRVLRRAHCPVLVVRGGLRVPPQKVLAPVDLSLLSAEAFGRGLGVLSKLGPAPEVEALFVLSVVERQTSFELTPEQIDRLAAEKLERFVEAHAGSVQVARKVRTGNTRAEIFAEIAGYHPDLVLLGTHGMGGFDRFAIGSVAADVTREAPCSVLVMPSQS